MQIGEDLVKHLNEISEKKTAAGINDFTVIILAGSSTIFKLVYVAQLLAGILSDTRKDPL